MTTEANLSKDEIVFADTIIDIQKDILRSILNHTKELSSSDNANAIAIISAAIVMAIGDINKAMGHNYTKDIIIKMLENTKLKEVLH